jgi:hypothetical protein
VDGVGAGLHTGAVAAAVVRDLHGERVLDAPFTWTSANPAVATVNDDGLARGVAAGEVTITAEAGSVSAQATLRVREVYGLLAEYYHMTGPCDGKCNFPNGEFVASRIESTINDVATPFQQPDQRLRSFWPDVVNPALFSVRWTGFVEPRLTANYQFCVSIDDAVRLWINNILVVDAWVVGPPREVCGQVSLVVGQRYALKMEMFQDFERSEARLFWETPNDRQRKDIIPASVLFAP